MIQKKTSCNYPPIGKLERPRFFPRQLVTPEELNLQQEYFRSRLRIRNIYLHGWGVVCGLGVKKSDGLTVCVDGGFAIGPCGNDILVQPQKVDIGRSGQTGSSCSPMTMDDPFCSQKNGGPEAADVYLAVKYKQVMTRPVKVQPTGCGGGESCEFSRYQDCYEFGILDNCPPDHRSSDLERDLDRDRGNPCCPPPAAHPWVVLAKIHIENGKVESVKICECRRIVKSNAFVFGNCRDDNDVGDYEPEKPSEEDPLIDKDENSKPMTDEEKAAAKKRAETVKARLEALKKTQAAGLSRLAEPALIIAGIGAERTKVLARHFAIERPLTTADILVMGETKKQRQAIADALPGSLADITSWVNQANLMRIEGMNSESAKVLADSGKSISDLAKLTKKSNQDSFRSALARKLGGVTRLPEPLKKKFELLVAAAQLVDKSDKVNEQPISVEK